MFQSKREKKRQINGHKTLENETFFLTLNPLNSPLLAGVYILNPLTSDREH